MSRMSEQPLDLFDQALKLPIRLATDSTATAGSGGAFLIDPDKAEPFIAEVRSAAERLENAKLAARQAGDIEVVPGGDLVTENAAIQAKKMAGNALSALDAYQRQLFATADELQDQLAAYRATEQANTTGPT